MLTFTGEEMDEVLKSMKVDTALGPDGLPVVFFKTFWSLVKPFIMEITNGFAPGRVDLSRLNFGICCARNASHEHVLVYPRRRGRYSATCPTGGQLTARYAKQQADTFGTRCPNPSGGTPLEEAGDDWLN